MRKSTAKDAIVRTAARLFYRQGYSNTGINQIIEEAGITKSTLYQQFRSKEDLLIYYLQETGNTTLKTLTEAAASAETPVEKITAVFDYLEELAIQPEFYGCHFLNIIFEMPDGEKRAREQIQIQKNAVRSLFRTLLEPAGKDLLSDEIYTLFEGALIGHKVHQDVWPILSAKRALKKIL